MPKNTKIGQKILSISPLIILILISVIWFAFFILGFSSFNKDNAVSIFGSVIQGMSALLSVAIAVIVFGIQSLENRNQLLEESTRNHISQIARFTYPQWIPSVEKDIRNKTIANRYYDIRVDRLRRTIGLSETDYEKSLKELQRDRDEQQKRLKETLNRHTRTKQTIQRMRKGIFSSVVLLALPILLSFLLLMVSDTLNPSDNFVFISIVVLMSSLGVASLTKTLLGSPVQS